MLPQATDIDDTDQLLARAQAGDRSACQELLARHRERLCKMVTVRLDRRLAARVDPSDVVQEALLDAAGRLSEYLRGRPLPFYPWLRQLAWERLVKVSQRHLRARKRSAAREVAAPWPLADESAAQLARLLIAPGTSPSNHLVREELRGRVRTALAGLADTDREVLLMRYLEQLSVKDIAAVLGITEGAVKMRHTRALQRLAGLLSSDRPEGAP
jgi:RNA polymerase sigma-70 factor (ECF subfamily)